jgi:DNA-binding response OmpR family regulator
MERTALIVDDDPRIVYLLALLLKEIGYEVATASSVLDGLVHLRTPRPTLVVIDVHLPDGDGLDLCRWIRADGDDHTTVIVVTADHRPAVTVKALAAGADDVVTKPFSVEELIARVNAAVRRHDNGLSVA